MEFYRPLVCLGGITRRAILSMISGFLGFGDRALNGRLYSAVTGTVADSLRQPNSFEPFALAVTCFQDAYLVGQVSYFSRLRYRLDTFDTLISNNERQGISIDTSNP